MILSGQTIAAMGMVSPCLPRTTEHGLTYGLGPAGYDVRLDLGEEWLKVCGQKRSLGHGVFTLAATLERFDMPRDVIGQVCDKSSLARLGLSVFNTIIEPGWRGYLTLELVNHGPAYVDLVQGQAIAQVVFSRMDQPTLFPYDGKYQDQAAGPQGARG